MFIINNGSSKRSQVNYMYEAKSIVVILVRYIELKLTFKYYLKSAPFNTTDIIRLRNVK